jgi:hypothetical protein
MKLRGGLALAAVLAGQLSVVGEVQAQYYGDLGVTSAIYSSIISLNNKPSDLACQNGEPYPASEVEKLTSIAPQLVQAYWAAVAGGKPPLEMFVMNKQTRWKSGATVLDKKTLATVKDPFVADGGQLDARPLAFRVAGDGASALGQWQVRDATGLPIGRYQALFGTRKGVWLISTLELIDARTWVDPVVQYCHAPGDVLGYRIKNAKERLAFAEPRLAQAKLIENSARAKSDRAKAAADAAPDNARKQEAARTAAGELAAAQNTRGAYQSMADKQRGDLAKAEAELQALEQGRAEGKAALAAMP